VDPGAGLGRIQLPSKVADHIPEDAMNLKVVASILAAVSLAASAAPAGTKVLIAPVSVQFETNWLRDVNEYRSRTERIGPADAERIAADVAASLQAALDAAVRARGFEVVNAPQPGVVQLSARVDDLFVNAPDPYKGFGKSYVRETGRATLRAEGRDTATGAVRLQTERRATAGDNARLDYASGVSNRFWFDALFRNWAEDVAKELAAR
jgi:hypothetical protein